MSVEVKKEIQRNLFCLKQLSFRQCATRRRQGQQRAIEEMETAQRLDPGEPSVLPFLGYGYAVTGRRAEALKILQSLKSVVMFREFTVPIFTPDSGTRIRLSSAWKKLTRNARTRSRGFVTNRNRKAFNQILASLR